MTPTLPLIAINFGHILFVRTILIKHKTSTSAFGIIVFRDAFGEGSLPWRAIKQNGKWQLYALLDPTNLSSPIVMDGLKTAIEGALEKADSNFFAMCSTR